jgi:hypothetical protein
VTPSMRDTAAAAVRAPGRRARSLRALCWFISGVAFLVGPAIGMTVNAEFGAAIWVSSALFALLPFSSHRHFGVEPVNRRPCE